MRIVSPEMDRLDVECSRRCDSYSGARSKIAARAPFHGRMIACLFGRPPRNFIFLLQTQTNTLKYCWGQELFFRRDPLRPAPPPAKAWPSLGQAAGPPVILPPLLPAIPPCSHLPPGLASPTKTSSGGSWAGLGGHIPSPLNFPTKFPTKLQCQKQAPH